MGCDYVWGARKERLIWSARQEHNRFVWFGALDRNITRSLHAQARKVAELCYVPV